MDGLSPTYLPVELNRNGSWVRTILLYDLAGGAVDASAWAIAGAVRMAAGAAGAALATFTVDAVDADNGQYLLTLLGSDLDALDGAQETIRLAYDVRATRSGRPPEILMQGPVILNPGVTQ